MNFPSRLDIESERKRQLQADVKAREQEESDVMKRSYKHMLEAKETAEKELEVLEKTHKDVKEELEGRIDVLEKENNFVRSQLEVRVISRHVTPK